MVRTLTASAEASKDTALGTTPIILIKAEWSSGTAYYADQEVTLTAIDAAASILSFSQTASQGTSDGVGEISSASVTLDDTDGSLKTLVNNVLIENTPVTVYQHFDGNIAADLTVILKGRIISEVVWSEGERTLSFEMETFIENLEVGFAPTEDDITNISPNAVDRPWPLGFGTVLKVPAVRVRRQPTGVLLQGVNSNFTSFQVDGGETFPQEEAINITLGAIRFSGSFLGNTFTVTDSNLAYYTNLAVASRPSDINYRDANVLWLQTTEQLTGLYCYINHATHGKMVNYCYKQEGKKCYFNKPWRPVWTILEVVMSSSDVIVEAAAFPRASWGVSYFAETITYQNRWYNPYANARVVSGTSVTANSWSALTGAPVRLLASYTDLYVFNLIASYQVFEVFGFRTLEGVTTFSPIPSSYYTKVLSGSLGGKTCSYLTFDTPLEDRIGEGWDGNVYVSYQSSVGPNGTDVISHILTNYTNITADTTSFNTVRPKITNYWTNFVLFDQPTALEAIQDIAWQLRCAIMIRNGSAYIKYLSEVPLADATITSADVLLKTVALGFTTTEEVYTKINADWKTDYSGQLKSEFTYVYKNNTDVLGTSELDRPITVYNNKELVEKTIAFWGYRYSNIWRKLSLTSTLKFLELEAFDTAAITLDTVSTNSIRGVLDRVTQDSEANTISLSMLLASRSGTSTANQPVEDLNYWSGDPTNPIVLNPGATNPATGREEVDYIVPTQGQTDSNPSSDTSTTSDPSEEPEYYLVFTSYPATVYRDTAFTLTVEVQSISGTKIIKDVVATIGSVLSDGSDSFNKTNIFIANGTWSATDCAVTGGADSDTIDLTLAASGYTGSSVSIDIEAERSIAPTWTIEAASVVRGTAFSVELLGSPLVYDVELISTDSNDVLYDSTGPVTQLEIAGSYPPTFSASDWYILGGQGSDTGTIVVKNATTIDGPGTQFPITGSSPYTIEHTLTMTQVIELNQGTLEITIPTSILDGATFEMIVTSYNSNGDVDTDWDTNLELILLDGNDDIVNWIDCGAGAGIFDNQTIVEMVDGVWTATCEVDWTGTPVSPFKISAQSPFPVATKEDFAELPFAGLPELVFTSSPVGVPRATNFTLTIELRTAGGTLITDVNPDCTITLAGAHASDVLNKTTIATGEWSSGIWTNTTMQITGGTGSLADVTITISADTEVVEDAIATIAIYTVASSIGRNTAYTLLQGYDYEWETASPVFDWTSIQTSAYGALVAATPTSGSSSSVNWATYSDATYYFNRYGDSKYTYIAQKYLYIQSYSISDIVKSATKVGVTINVTHTGKEKLSVSVARNQPDIELFISETSPTTYSEASTIGVSLGTVACNALSTNEDLIIPVDFISSMTGNTLYLWGIAKNWYVDATLYEYSAGRYLRFGSAQAFYNGITILT